MTPKVRAVLVYVACRLISGTEAPFVFDFSGRGHRSMGGTVNDKCVNVYDYSENCQMTGNSSAGLFQLFHYGERVHVSLEILGDAFRGYDHGLGKQFNGTVRGSKVSLYDQADHLRHAYWCESPRYSRLPGQVSGGAEIELDSQAQ